ncbi:MAG: carbohydate-binding domain-containing protein [Gammaproteobacteria bacterium]|nr:carbohydate-binding domain-containing protein [Gammaproteobacteria bacterium]MBU2183790.1 carbohydate-binding domain-containing protein [Gammaproteobacteria bacterium]MBU2206511.1 carbohydate-binding domain-containing protein [Gammaproteobacteria bacterium]
MRILILLLLLFSLPVWATNWTQQQLADFANGSTLHFAVDSNQLAEASRFRAAIVLHNNSSVALPAGQHDWQIYFHLIRRVDTTEQQGLRIQHVQGDLHSLSPTADFAGLARGQQLQLVFESAPWLVSYSDFMPRAFIVSKPLQPEVFANTDTEDLQQFVLPLTRDAQLQRNFGSPDLVTIATPERRFASNLALNGTHNSNVNPALRIIPTPQQVNFSKKRITLGAHWQLKFSGAASHEARYLQQQLQQLGIELGSNADSKQPLIELTITPALPLAAEGYQLSLSAKRISLNAKDNAGAFYAVQSLLALLQQQGDDWLLPEGNITDQPRAAWRGMHYDMARNFHGKDVTLRLIDNMARYKLNKLHLHLTEDEGWRLEIPGLPELTSVGAYRCFDLTEQQCLLTQLGTGPHKQGSGNGYYSTADFIEILRYAGERHIEVIPEIDLPGHARAAIVAMNARYNRLMALGQPDAARAYLLAEPGDSSQYISVQNYTDNAANVCLPSTYAFVDKVIYELQQLYRQAGQTLHIFHMGGDEVAAGAWQSSAACQQLFAAPGNGVSGVADLKPYFVRQLAQLTAQRGLALAGWEDGLMYDKLNTFERSQLANPRILANAWDNIWEWGVADRAYRLANNGYQVILSPGTHLYFDHPHEAHPQERGYYWATRFTGIDTVFGFMPDDLYANAVTTRDGADITDLEKLLGRALPPLLQPENIVGIQGQVWTETIRSAEQLEHMIYPRLLALAERAWHKAGWEHNNDPNSRQADWHSFASRLAQVELARLAKQGSSYYLPPPGARWQHDKLTVNTALPGLSIEFSLDGGKNWQAYSDQSVLPAEALLFRSRAGAVTSRSVDLSPVQATADSAQ